MMRDILTAGDVIGAGALGYAGLSALGGGSAAAGASKVGSGVANLLKGKGAIAEGVGKAGGFIKRNKEAIEMAGKGISALMPDRASEAAMMRAETERMQFEAEKRQLEQQRKDKEAIARLLMPMYGDYMKQLGYPR